MPVVMDADRIAAARHGSLRRGRGHDVSPAHRAPERRDDSKIIAPAVKRAASRDCTAGATGLYDALGRVDRGSGARTEQSLNFSNQTVVVTGASGNLGAAVARAFAACEDTTVCVCRRGQSRARRAWSSRR